MILLISILLSNTYKKEIFDCSVQSFEPAQYCQSADGKWNIATQYEIILEDYEIFCLRRKWNKICPDLFASPIRSQRISHLRSKYFTVKQGLTCGDYFTCPKGKFHWKSPIAKAIGLFLVGVARLELAASWSQTRCPTNWATPRYLILFVVKHCGMNNAECIMQNA